jgi:hypothetical protein
MNRVLTVALAGLVATATIGTTIGSASAGGYGYGGYGYGYGKPWKGHPPGPPPGHWHNNGGGNWGAALAGGAVLGFALGATLAPPPPPRYVYVAPPPPPVYAYEQPVYAQPAYPQLSQAHVDWCAATYPNYQPQTDTYLASNGVYYRCVGPY